MMFEGDDWGFGGLDESSFECGSAFWTEEEAERELKRRKAYVILKEDTKGFEPDWKNTNARKYAVYYDYVGKKLETDMRCTWQSQPGLYFATRKDAEVSIKSHGKEWKALLGVEDE